jgi:hypothetical protein
MGGANTGVGEEVVMDCHPCAGRGAFGEAEGFGNAGGW